MDISLTTSTYAHTFVARIGLLFLLAYLIALLLISRRRNRLSAWATPMALAPFFAGAIVALWEVATFAGFSAGGVHSTAAIRGEALRFLFFGCFVAAFVSLVAYLRDRENAPLPGSSGNSLLIVAAAVLAMVLATLKVPLLPHTAMFFRAAAVVAFAGLLLSLRLLFSRRDITHARTRAGVCALVAAAACVALWYGANVFREIASRP